MVLSLEEKARIRLALRAEAARLQGVFRDLEAVSA
jgi:hypothetical protein